MQIKNKKNIKILKYQKKNEKMRNFCLEVCE